MSILFRRKAIVPVWFGMFGLFALLGPSMTFATSVFVLLLGTMAPTIMLILWKTPQPTIAEVLNLVETSWTAGHQADRASAMFPRERIHMRSARILAIVIAWAVISPSAIAAQDLSSYRGFQLGMSLDAVAQQAGIASEARVIHRRPELIQELTWEPPRSLGSPRPGESVRKVLLSFYNGELFRIVVSYQWDRTEGLTVEDMVDALSVTYGHAMLPATEIASSLSRVSTESDRIVAHWGDPQHAINLVRPSYASTFGLVMFSKPLDALARAASIEAIRLNEQEAPGRAIERQRQQEDEAQARQEKARTENKATFRP
jgi:hypothetical protein